MQGAIEPLLAVLSCKEEGDLHPVHTLASMHLNGHTLVSLRVEITFSCLLRREVSA